MRHHALLFAALASLAASAAYAQSGLGNIANQAQMQLKNFDIADKNKDGLLTKEEAENGPVPFIRAHFDAIDKNHRGAVSKQDVIEYVQSLQRGRSAEPAAAASTH
ncbi:EF-hand domain-containing protein [Dyella sp. C11]|uniref:EF-hand domain-containing protein n=1 Tax=Dyella sp. C11 TaxID=2126991 RepID=UPI000D65017C|nr:EF-hand domain-containing protein [Dyella sp. C11]